MNDVDFNLLYEPWISVMDYEGKILQMGIMDTLNQAHKIKSLAGETPTQDVTIIRLLLAIISAIYLRTDSDGTKAHLTDEEDAVERWGRLWERNRFDSEHVQQYLVGFEDRFYLFHPKFPFYQSPIEKGTEYTSPKLIGDLLESSNKLRLFSNRNGAGKVKISYAEAARWILHLNAFDDTSAKPTVRGGNMPSPGAGWLGKLGLIYAEGKNLFETLMLNFVMTDHNYDPFPDGKAIWESSPRIEERVIIPMPESPLEILTLQSRRILLKREEGFVTGYILMGGDIVDRENALIEQMTVWRKDKTGAWLPKRHDPSRLMWRDFSAMMSGFEDNIKPGVVRWISSLVAEDLLPDEFLTFRITGIKYGDKDFFAEDTIDDGMVFNAELLSSLGESWIHRISNLIKRTEDSIYAFGTFAQNLSIDSGNDAEGKSAKNDSASAREMAYFHLDMPFRRWLQSINPVSDDEESRLNEWTGLVYSVLVDNLGKQLLEDAGVQAMVGSSLQNNSISRYRLFRNSVRKILRGD